MEREFLFLVVAAAVAVVGLVASPMVRAICWDSLAHPRYSCTWKQEGDHLRELKAGVDYPEER
jgi:hypothetical protein